MRNLGLFAQVMIVASSLGTFGCSDFRSGRPDGGRADAGRGLADGRGVDAPFERPDASYSDLVDDGAANGTDESTEGPPALDSSCQQGTHVCGSVCADSRSPDSCGSSCEPCPQVGGGTRTCDGVKCGGTCPTGQQLCLGNCVPAGQACSGQCPTGTHNCGGICSDDKNVNSCGTACAPCSPPAGAAATCDGKTCDFVCQSGKHCSAGCFACCVDNDCPAVAGQIAQCDSASHACKYSCPTSMKLCGASCIAGTACCKDSDCAPSAGHVGQCDTGTHACSYSCGTGTKPCGSNCIPAAGCCADGDCGGHFSCVLNSCSTTTCVSQYRKCGSTCIATSAGTCCDDTDCTGHFSCVANACSGTKCQSGYMFCSGTAVCIPMASGSCCADANCTGNFACLANSCSSTVCRAGYRICNGTCMADHANFCCGDSDCGKCKKCVSNTCQNESTTEDVKSECSDTATCRTGTCNGSGDCGFTAKNSPGTGCTGGCNQCDGNGNCTNPAITCYFDNDSDGHGDPKMAMTACVSCPAHYVVSNDDCDDNNANAHPGADFIFTNMKRNNGTADWNCDGTTQVSDGKGMIYTGTNNNCLCMCDPVTCAPIYTGGAGCTDSICGADYSCDNQSSCTGSNGNCQYNFVPASPQISFQTFCR